MAWLQNLAGHAENLLNKIDQNAATVLSDGNKINTDDLERGNQNFVEPEKFVPFTRSMLSNGSLNHLSISPVKELFNECNSDKENDAVFATVAENTKSYGNIIDESFFDKSVKSSASSSSIHNSFSVSQEIDVLQAKLAKLELENQDNNKQLLNMHHFYSEMRNQNANLQSQIERTNEQLMAAQNEKDQYVARAQRILQEKEKLIALKETSSSNEAEQNIMAMYNEELKKELEFQQNRVKDLNEKNDKLVNDVTSLQMQYQVIQKRLDQSNQSLEQSLSNEKKYRVIAEEDCSQKTKELYLKNQELLQMHNQIASKDLEIRQLQTSIKQRSESNMGEEFEDRIKSLTHTLMLKQNTLETVTTERNALKLQLEKLEVEHRKTINKMKRDQIKVINVQESGDERINFPQFLRVSPRDAGVTRRVKHAYSTLDAISVRTGIFLRRYPLARVFVFSYMVILHVWVFMVLFWDVPSNRQRAPNVLF